MRSLLIANRGEIVARIAAGGGPIHTRPAVATASARAAFSLRKP